MRELKRIHIYGCRCDERLKAKTEGSKRLAYTGLNGGRGHLKIETMLKDERFESVRDECDLYVLDDKGVSSILRLLLNTVALTRIFPTLDLRCEKNTALR
jgi:hypothetical protein